MNGRKKTEGIKSDTLKKKVCKAEIMIVMIYVCLLDDKQKKPKQRLEGCDGGREGEERES